MFYFDILFIHSGKLLATRNVINGLILGQFVQSDFFLILLSLLKIFQVRKQGCTQIPISTLSHIWVFVRLYGIVYVIIVIIIIIIMII